MEFDIVPQLVIIFSMGIIILILGRNISKVKETADDFLFEDRKEKKEREKFRYLYKRLARRINREKYQERVDSFWIWLEKVLRKLRINFLRLDNKIVSALDKVKEKNIENDAETEAEVENKDQERGADEAGDSGNVKVKNESIYTDKKEDDKNENIDRGDIDENTGARGVVGEVKDDNKNEEINVEADKLNVENKDKKGKEKEYIDLILKNPIDIKSYWKLGIIYSRKRNYRDAISCFRQITKIDPTYTKAKKKISELVEKMRKKETDEKNRKR